MGNTVYLFTLLIFISVTAFVVLVGSWFYFRYQKEELKRRLGRIASYGAGIDTGTGLRTVQSQAKKQERPPIPILGRLLAGITRVASKGREGATQRKASVKTVSPEARLGLAVVFAMVAFGFSRAIGVGFFESTMLVTCGFLVGFMIPGAIVAHKNRTREMEIRKALPDMLDLLTMSVEAGLGFDRALARVIEGKKGPLANEFEIVLQEIRIGRPRREALRDLSERLKMPEVSRLVGSIIQAEELGMGIANSLRIQSEQLRLARRQRAEEAAMKAPIKMLFPLIFFIFPALFVVLLGPAIIQMVVMFVRMGE